MLLCTLIHLAALVSMSICDETLSPGDAKLKFEGIADGEFAERLQQEEFSSLKGSNVSTSQTRHQNVTVGSRVATKVSLQEDTLYKIVGQSETYTERVCLCLSCCCCRLLRDGAPEAGGDGPGAGREDSGPGEGGRGRGANMAFAGTHWLQSHQEQVLFYL